MILRRYSLSWTVRAEFQTTDAAALSDVLEKYSFMFDVFEVIPGTRDGERFMTASGGSNGVDVIWGYSVDDAIAFVRRLARTEVDWIAESFGMPTPEVVEVDVVVHNEGLPLEGVGFR